MRKTRLLPVIIFIFVQLAAWAQQGAGQQPWLEISGDVSHPHTYQEQEWKGLKHISISATNAHENKTSTFSGVPLRDLLREAGAPSGEGLRGKAMTITVIAKASDGYQVAFSIGELDESIGNLQVLVADSEDGKPLGANNGPLRLVVPSDKRPARWVRMLGTIRVVANP